MLLYACHGRWAYFSSASGVSKRDIWNRHCSFHLENLLIILFMPTLNHLFLLYQTYKNNYYNISHAIYRKSASVIFPSSLDGKLGKSPVFFYHLLLLLCQVRSSCRPPSSSRSSTTSSPSWEGNNTSPPLSSLERYLIQLWKTTAQFLRDPSTRPSSICVALAFWRFEACGWGEEGNDVLRVSLQVHHHRRHGWVAICDRMSFDTCVESREEPKKLRKDLYLF